MRETSSRPGKKRSRRTARSHDDGQLTARERDVLRLLATGMGTDAIARHLAISTATVRNHAQRILSKLRVHSRLAAVAHGYSTGLITPSTWRVERESGPAVL